MVWEVSGSPLGLVRAGFGRAGCWTEPYPPGEAYFQFGFAGWRCLQLLFVGFPGGTVSRFSGSVAGSVPDRGIDQHLAERTKHLPHLGLFVWKNLGGVHRVNRHSAIHFENQQLSDRKSTRLNSSHANLS